MTWSSARKGRRHAALAEFALDGVATFQGSVQAFGGISHGPKMRGWCEEGQENRRRRPLGLSRSQERQEVRTTRLVVLLVEQACFLLVIGARTPQ